MKKIIGLILVLSIGFSIYHFYSKDPKQVILKNLAELALDLSVSPGETIQIQLQKASYITRKFDENFEVVYKFRDQKKSPITNSKELKQAVLSFRKWLKQVQFQFVDIEFDEISKTVKVKSHIQAQFPRTQEKAKVSDKLAIEFVFSKKGRHWLITHVEILNNIEILTQ